MGEARARGSPAVRDLRPSGFVVLRTPLLPYATALSLSEALDAPRPDQSHLAAALEADRQKVRGRLDAILSRPDVTEAVFLASPDLYNARAAAGRAHDPDRLAGLDRSLARYITRLATRPTPFGLFAGCSVGTVGGPMRLEVGAQASSRRHTRLDMEYVASLLDDIAHDPVLRDRLRWRSNTTLYEVAGRFCYVDVRHRAGSRSHHLAAIERNPHLDAVLASANDGAPRVALIGVMCGRGIDADRAARFIDQLIERQLLVADLEAPLTGPDALQAVIRQLRVLSIEPAATVLEVAADLLRSIDAIGVGVGIDHYHTIARTLGALPTTIRLPRLVQVDLMRSASEVTVSDAVVTTVLQGIRTLHRLTSSNDDDALARFRLAFVERFGDRAVPLVEALDSEVGVPFKATADPAPLLRGIPFPASIDRTTVWRPRDDVLLAKLLDATVRRLPEIVLTQADIEAMEDTRPAPPLPLALAAVVTLVADGPEALTRGRYSVLLHSASGPSGARLLGRFSQADETLRANVALHLAAEEALSPAAFAEVVHVPEGRVGNVVQRPVLRRYEIVYLGASGAPSERQLPVTDLLIAVRHGRVVLTSKRLDVQIEPRVTTAFNPQASSLPIYQLLHALQSQGVCASLRWNWGPVAAAPFLPRVRHGAVVLALATWRINEVELRQFGSWSGPETFSAVQRWRRERDLPRLIELVDDDNTLLVDLDNVVLVESFVHLVRARDHAVVREVWPGPDQLCVQGPDGLYAHELVVPFVATAPSGLIPAARLQQHAPKHQVHHPGSRWLYLKLYCGEVTADDVIRRIASDAGARLVDTNLAERWFFIRYRDPDPHVRLRFLLSPTTSWSDAQQVLTECVAPLVAAGSVRRVSFDTYEREVDRYGGPEGMDIAERVFHADSDAVLGILHRLSPGEDGAEARWHLAARGVDTLFDGLGLSAKRKWSVAGGLRDRFAEEFRFDGPTKSALSQRYRVLRPRLHDVLAPQWADDYPLAEGFQLLATLGDTVAGLAVPLRALGAAGVLTTSIDDLAASFAHMHVNRVMRSSHRQQEAVLYDLLHRFYTQQGRRGILDRSDGARD